MESHLSQFMSGLAILSKMTSYMTFLLHPYFSNVRSSNLELMVVHLNFQKFGKCNVLYCEKISEGCEETDNVALCVCVRVCTCV